MSIRSRRRYGYKLFRILRTTVGPNLVSPWVNHPVPRSVQLGAWTRTICGIELYRVGWHFVAPRDIMYWRRFLSGCSSRGHCDYGSTWVVARIEVGGRVQRRSPDWGPYRGLYVCPRYCIIKLLTVGELNRVLRRCGEPGPLPIEGAIACNLTYRRLRPYCSQVGQP